MPLHAPHLKKMKLAFFKYPPPGCLIDSLISRIFFMYIWDGVGKRNARSVDVSITISAIFYRFVEINRGVSPSKPIFEKIFLKQVKYHRKFCTIASWIRFFLTQVRGPIETGAYC